MSCPAHVRWRQARVPCAIWGLEVRREGGGGRRRKTYVKWNSESTLAQLKWRGSGKGEGETNPAGTRTHTTRSTETRTERRAGAVGDMRVGMYVSLFGPKGARVSRVLFFRTTVGTSHSSRGGPTTLNNRHNPHTAHNNTHAAHIYESSCGTTKRLLKSSVNPSM